MNWLDLVLLLILGSSMLAGFRTGLTRTVVGIVTVVLALVLSIWTYGVAGGFLLDYVSHRSVANFLGFVMVFTVVMIVGSITGRVLAKMFKWVGLGWLDRLMGAGVGLVRGLFVSMGLVMLLCAFTRTPPPQSVVHSQIAPYVLDASSVLAAIAPRELRDGFHTSYDKVKEIWNKMLKGAPAGLAPQKM